MEEMGVDHLTLCDTTGMAYPNQVEALLGHEVPSQIVKAGRRLDLHPVPPPSRPSASGRWEALRGPRQWAQDRVIPFHERAL